MPSLQSPMITGVVADVLCMYTVLRVLPCYRIVLPCYRCSVTEVLNHSSGFRISVFQFENGMHSDADADAIGYWLLSSPTLSPIVPPQSRERYGHTATYSSNRFTKAIPLINQSLYCLARCHNSNGARNKGGEGRTAYQNMYSSPPNLREAKLKKRRKKTTLKTRMNTGVGEIDQLVV